MVKLFAAGYRGEVSGWDIFTAAEPFIRLKLIRSFLKEILCCANWTF